VDLTVPVTVQSVGWDTMESTVMATGTLRAVKEAQLATEVEGLFFLSDTNGSGKLAEGSRVEKGQLVARLVNEELMANARIDSRNLALSTAMKTLKEKEVMFKRGLVTEKEVDEARRVAADAESNLKDSNIQIKKTQIRSPIGGVLTGVTNITEGTLIAARTELGTVMDYDRVLVDLKIPNAYIARISIGQTLRVENYAFTDRIFIGNITGVDPALDPTTRTFRVVGTVDNPDLMLRPGMFVKAAIVTESHEGVIVIPRRYVLTRQSRKVVFVEEEGRAQIRNVVTGLEDRENVEITDGIEEGERLITSNYETLRARTRVRVTGEGVPGSN
jgi:membrane fusion protein (multidrug efflux system)